MLLATKNDLEDLLDNCAVLVSRILVKYIGVFAKFQDEIPMHIPQEKMNKKSEVVSVKP